MNSINTFDIDGVIFMGFDKGGVYPGPRDVIITGRSNQEIKETLDMLNEKNINNVVYFNPLPYDQKTRETSGEHKARIIRKLINDGSVVSIHFDDDPIQADIIRRAIPEIEVVLLQHDLVEKENVRHVKDENHG